MEFLRRSRVIPGCCVVITLLFGAQLAAGDSRPTPEQGLTVLRTHTFLPADFNEEILDELWTVWPEPERTAASSAPPTERRQLTYRYYGLMPTPAGLPGDLPVLGYTSDGDGGWVMNCLTCHGGKVAGQVIPGLPNTHLALQTLAEDARAVKLRRKEPLAHLDLASLTIPLNTTNGSSNSVIFGVVLGAFRLPDMSVDLSRQVPALVHHDMDAPPFWNVRKKSSLYIDGFAPKTHRPLMQFMLLPKNSKETVLSWEEDFLAIEAWINSVEPPRYSGPIDRALSTRGEAVFRDHCATCHGTYGPEGRYVQRTIPWDEIRTDKTRLEALTPEHRTWMKEGWMSRFGADPVVVEPVGYVAPPLDGVWASAPYLHNGSVPTLWHLLHPDHRPTVWHRTEDGYDHRRMGLEVQELTELPDNTDVPAHRRRYFDTRLPGKSSQGHDFPNVLSVDEREALLEYLKTL